MANNVYKQQGYEDRDDYLQQLAAEHGAPIETVINLAELLGPNEDFDGLVTTLQDFEGSYE